MFEQRCQIFEELKSVQGVICSRALKLPEPLRGALATLMKRGRREESAIGL